MRMGTAFKLSALVAAVFVAVTAAIEARAASVLSLGNNGTPHGISNDGKIVVGEVNIAQSGFYNPLAFRWVAGGSFTFNGPEGAATGLSADGSIASGWRFTGTFGNLPPQPFRWTQTTNWVSLGLPPGADDAGAFGISADGSTVMLETGSCGAAGCFLGGSASAFYKWTQATGFVPLNFGGGVFSGPSFLPALSADGSTIVGYKQNFGPFRWTESTGVVSLGQLSGLISATVPYAVSADGSVVVGKSDGHAFRWTEATGMVDLGIGAAYALSADGSIVIGEGPPNPYVPEAFYWTQAGGTQMLNEMLPGYGIDTTGWYFDSGLSITADGHAMVVRGYSPGAVNESLFLVNLAVPEPTASELILGVIVGFASMRQNIGLRAGQWRPRRKP